MSQESKIFAGVTVIITAIYVALLIYRTTLFIRDYRKGNTKGMKEIWFYLFESGCYFYSKTTIFLRSWTVGIILALLVTLGEILGNYLI